MSQVHDHAATSVSHAEHRDARPRSRRLLGPLAAGASVVLATGFIALVDPNQPGHYPMCPTAAFLGLDCPACGGLRATHALAQGDVATALDHNLLFVLLVPAIIVGWGVWVWRAWTGRRPAMTARRQMLGRVVPIAFLIVMMTFAVVRNLVPYLGSGVG